MSFAVRPTAPADGRPRRFSVQGCAALRCAGGQHAAVEGGEQAVGERLGVGVLPQEMPRRGSSSIDFCSWAARIAKPRASSTYA